MLGEVRTSVSLERIRAIAKYLGINELDLALGPIQDHGVTITTSTAGGYFGLKPGKDIRIAVVAEQTVQHINEELLEEHLSNARALVIRNDRGPHIHICLCDRGDTAKLDAIVRELAQEHRPMGREFPDIVIEHTTGRAA